MARKKKELYEFQLNGETYVQEPNGHICRLKEDILTDLRKQKAYREANIFGKVKIRFNDKVEDFRKDPAKAIGKTVISGVKVLALIGAGILVERHSSKHTTDDSDLIEANFVEEDE